MTLTIELDDTVHGPGWVNRHDEGFVLAPGMNHLRIWLNNNMTFNANPGTLDLAHIGRFLFEATGFTTDTTVYLDNLRLDNVPDDPYTDAARSIWKFDLGPSTSPVWPDFFQLTAGMQYPQDATTRPFGWTNSVQSRSLTGPVRTTWIGISFAPAAVRCAVWSRWTSPSTCPTATTKSGSSLVARDWDGFPTTGWSVTAEGTQVLDVPMDSTTFYADWYFRGLHEDFPGSDSTWNVWEKPQFPSYTFSTTVSDGQLNLSFQGSVGVFAMVVYPASLESEMSTRIAGYDVARTRSSRPTT